MKYLGHVISSTGVKPQDSKIAAIEQWPIPKSQTEVRQFLGLVNYYRQYVYNFSHKAKPLTELLKKDALFEDATFAPNSDPLEAFNVRRTAGSRLSSLYTCLLSAVALTVIALQVLSGNSGSSSLQTCFASSGSAAASRLPALLTNSCSMYLRRHRWSAPVN